MLKVYQIAVLGKVDPVLIGKLILLDRLVRFYSKFLSNWKTAGVASNGQEVHVKFMSVNRYGYENFTERMFPIEDVDKRIDSYKEKIAVEFAKRHDNVRIQRAKEVHKWKKYIDDAKISMQ